MSRKLKIIILIMVVICIILLGTSIYLLTKKKNQIDNGENNEILNNAITENVVEENIEKDNVINTVEQNEIVEQSNEEIKQTEKPRQTEVKTENTIKNTTTKANNKIETQKPVQKQQEQTTTKVEKKQEVKKETKVEEQKPQETKKEEPKVARCTTNSNHGIDIGNSNRWFDSYNSAVAYYDNLISNYGSKLRAGEITIEEYDKKCPCGYETWSCPYCGKWTVNFYYR